MRFCLKTFQTCEGLTHKIRETISKFCSACLSRCRQRHRNSEGTRETCASGGAGGVYQPPKMIHACHLCYH